MQDRGLIFGSDHNSRGRNVVEFGDYFRTHRWIQAAGCDQPGLSKDVIKNKVASSIAHLYEHPRTWLEGFYGSGWNTSTSMLLDALFANYAEGQNLLSLHGLYYSTLGGWWEWAPPGNHFHEPYWAEMPALLGMMERLSYLLSQGYHCADVAIIYPVESVVAGDGGKSVRCAFQLGEQLYSQGIDFDFIDYGSLAKASVKDKALHVSGENYSVLVIPSMKTIQSATLQKALDFQRAGGIVLSVDDRADQTELGAMDEKRKAASNELQHCASDEVLDYITHHINLDFKTEAVQSVYHASPYRIPRSLCSLSCGQRHDMLLPHERIGRTVGSLDRQYASAFGCADGRQRHLHQHASRLDGDAAHRV
jgi:hypothetical protein